jgi:HK97 family phage major capsid protein
MALMGPFERVRALFAAPPSPRGPKLDSARWTNPIGFTVSVPSEMTGMALLDGSRAPKIRRDVAIQVPSVKRVRDLIAGTLGTLQPQLINSKNEIQPWELGAQPEANEARTVTMTRIVEDMLFEQRSWLRITEMSGGWPSKVVRLEPDSVSVQENSKVWVNRSGNSQGHSWEWVPDSQLIRIESPNDGLLTAGAAAIRACLQLQRTAGRYAEDPMPLGYFTPKEGVAGPEDPEKMLNDWEDQRARRAWGYLEDMDAKTLTWNPEELQLGTARDYAVLEIARLGGVDPEELGVSTTSRTYANSEQRRLDLIDFTLIAYVTAIEGRLSMNDVTRKDNRVVYDYSGFLRSDTLSRLQAYREGLEIGLYTPKRIADIERVPVFTVPKPPKPEAPAAPPNGAPAPPNGVPKPNGTNGVPKLTKVGNMLVGAAPAFAAATEDAVQFSFGHTDGGPQFKADKETRTVTGLAIPWNRVAYSMGYRWMFAPGSLHWSDASRVKLDKDHVNGTEFGSGRQLDNTEVGLTAKFGVSATALGDEMLTLATDGVYDGFSVWAGFDSEADGWTSHPEDPDLRYVHSATLRKVALTAMPAFDDARLTSVAASREGVPVTAPTVQTPAPAGTPIAPPIDWAAFTQGLTTAVTASVEQAAQAAFARIGAPTAPVGADGTPVVPEQRATVQAASGIQVTREAPIYTMNGNGPSFVRDTWKMRTEGDQDAAGRVRKFMLQTEEAARSQQALLAGSAAFAVNTGNASGVVPPGYRPDMFVSQLLKERPLVNSVSRGTLTDATPFNIPKYVSSTNEAAPHVEGVNPTQGTLVLGVTTVSPGAISGTFQLTREIVDSANPAIDAIAMAAMRESYSQQTEALVYAELNGVNGVGGTITSGFVPSGAQAATTTGQGDELLAGVRAQMALYPFRRFGSIDRAHLSQEGTTAFATAVDTTGRPLLPYLGAMNAQGTASVATQGYLVDGVTMQPTWSMTGNAAGDADVLMFNSTDVWAWESGLLMFRYEERSGPANIDLALFGYFATRVLRPVGLSGIRHTAS